jgi:Flp pilus assembly protein TadG
VSGWTCRPVRRCAELSGCRTAASGRPPRRFLSLCDGQSTVEIVGALPLLVVVVLAAAELLAAGAARVSASSAADAAAMALLQGGDPAAAARSAAPDWTHSHITVHVSGRHARVRLSPPSLVPGLSNLLSTTAKADAGPAPEQAS